MGSQQTDNMAEKIEKNAAMNILWEEAAKEFETICGKSLQNGPVKNFNDVQTAIENAGKEYGTDKNEKHKWENAKLVTMESLKYLKMLVGAASQASDFIPVPSGAVNITTCALCYVFDIPSKIQNYNEAVDDVFTQVSSVLSRFKIYLSTADMNHPALINQIHIVMTNFVRLCAYVVKYRQSNKMHRTWQQFKSTLGDDSGLKDAMNKLKDALAQQHDLEGTISLAIIIQSHHHLEVVLLGLADTLAVVKDTQKGVQDLTDDANRVKVLGKIRDALDIPGTVRLETNTTQTCTKIYEQREEDMGSWILANEAYQAWMAPQPPEGKAGTHMLLLDGPPSSGKTIATSIITKQLEGHGKRVYVAHYFFATGAKKSEDERYSVISALKYMAFQIARVDQTVLKTLGKACDNSDTFWRLSDPKALDQLWTELTIGTSSSGASYVFVFDGLENVPSDQVECLLGFSSGLARYARRIRVLASGTPDLFKNTEALHMSMVDNNVKDMQVWLDHALKKHGILQNTKAGSAQQQARDQIMETLPQKVGGSYSQLRFELDEVLRLLGAGKGLLELDRLLNTSTSSREAAIKSLERSLNTKEIGELNEMLNWILHSSLYSTLDMFEAIMLLYNDTESLVSLEYTIRNKFSAVLKVDDHKFVDVQDGVKEYLRRDEEKKLDAQDSSTISMNISIKNVDRETCANFLWDLSQKAIREKFKFEFDTASSSSLAVIAVDEFSAHRAIVTRILDYFLGTARMDIPVVVGPEFMKFLPEHLQKIRELEEKNRGALLPSEKATIGEKMYKVFTDDKILQIHQPVIDSMYSDSLEMGELHNWMTDWTVTRKLDKEWREEVRLARSPTRGFLKHLAQMIVSGFLRSRTLNSRYASIWAWNFMRADTKEESSAWFFTEDVEKFSKWCQEFLGLSDSELDSLWYERLGEALHVYSVDADQVVSLYERAISKENPSWMCHRGLGMAHFSAGHYQKAAAEMELALEGAQKEDATDKPGKSGVAGLHLWMSRCADELGDSQKAADHFQAACASDDKEQANEARLGHIRARLDSTDEEKARQVLKDILAEEGGEEKMEDVLRLVARDVDHSGLVERLFAVTKVEPELLRGIVQAMETVTAKQMAREGLPTKTMDDEQFAENEVRGALLYDRGVAAYQYNILPRGTTSKIDESLQLWKESRLLLTGVGGSNASTVRRNAITALGRHYFQTMMDDHHLNQIDELATLDEDSEYDYANSVSFLGALYSWHGKKDQAKTALRRRIDDALQILSDAILENDAYGFIRIFEASIICRDFRNAAIALSLYGPPDIVTDGLSFDMTDIDLGGDEQDEQDEDEATKKRVLGIVAALAKNIITSVKIQIPDSSQQLQRIEAAKKHADLFAIADPSSGNEIASKADPSARKPAETAIAYALLQGRMSDIQNTHKPRISFTTFPAAWTCDGSTTDGKPCRNTLDFENEFYQCMYCGEFVFCRSCLARLRDPSEGVTMRCSAKHQWIQTPPFGTDMYVGPRATSLRVPGIKQQDNDKSIYEFLYTDMETREVVEVQDWKNALAGEWGIGGAD